jgi:hypothetical protein
MAIIFGINYNKASFKKIKSKTLAKRTEIGIFRGP